MKKEIDVTRSRLEIAVKATLLGVLVTAAAMLIFAGIMLGLDTDRAYAAAFATASLAAGCFFAAFYAAKKIGQKGYLVGLAVGGAVFAVLTVVSLAVCKGSVTLNTLFHLVIVVLASVAGGISGVNRNQSRKYI